MLSKFKEAINKNELYGRKERGARHNDYELIERILRKIGNLPSFDVPLDSKSLFGLVRTQLMH